MAEEYTKMASFKKETASPQNEGILNYHDTSVANRNSLPGPLCIENTDQDVRQTSTTVADVCAKGRFSVTQCTY